MGSVGPQSPISRQDVERLVGQLRTVVLARLDAGAGRILYRITASPDVQKLELPGGPVTLAALEQAEAAKAPDLDGLAAAARTLLESREEPEVA